MAKFDIKQNWWIIALAIVAILFVAKGKGFMGSIITENPRCTWHESGGIAGDAEGWLGFPYGSSTYGKFFKIPYRTITWDGSIMTFLNTSSCSKLIGDLVADQYLQNVELSSVVENEKRINYVNSLEASSPFDGWFWCDETNKLLIGTDNEALKNRYISEYSSCGACTMGWAPTTCLFNPSPGSTCEGYNCTNSTNSDPCYGYHQDGMTWNPILNMCEYIVPPTNQEGTCNTDTGGYCPEGGVYNPDLMHCEICSR